ncbi:MAG: hypothetical protein DSO01_05950 [Archaeoglobi archaeon]|nr:MAG: hypothetical protein DSO01_05950 [Archaeoglobi archaeon]
MESYSRLIYIIRTLGIQLPRKLLSLFPDWVVRALSGELSEMILLKVMKEGAALGEPKVEELQYLFLSLLESSDLPLQRKAELYGLIPTLSQPQLVEGKKILRPDQFGEPIKPMMTRTFFDHLLGLGGVFPGLYVIQGRSGGGKTSLLLSFANSVKSTVIFVETEISERMMGYRLRGVPKWQGDTWFFIGSYGPKEILEEKRRLKLDKDTILIYDSPDMLFSGENSREVLTTFYRELALLREEFSLILVASQVRRKDRASMLTLDSVSEAYYKAWVADAVISIQNIRGGTQMIVSLTTSKNRFGPTGLGVDLQLNILTLESSVLRDSSGGGEGENDDDW